MTNERIDEVLSILDRAIGDPEPNPDQWINVNAVPTTHCPTTREDADATAIESRIGVLHVSGAGVVTYHPIQKSSTYVIRIDADGTITEYEGWDLAGIAARHFGGRSNVDVVSFSGPGLSAHLPPDFPLRWISGRLVGAVHEWGYSQDPAVVNPKAWGLYGNSPIVGTAFVALDSYDDDDPHDAVRPKLPSKFIEMMREDWVKGPTMNVERMKKLSEEQDLVWPN